MAISSRVLIGTDYLHLPVNIDIMKGTLKNTLLIPCLIFFAQSMMAQDLPVSNLYLFTLTEKETGYSLRYPKFLTVFNKDGYNNQPNFASDFDIYLSSNYGKNGSIEVIKLNLFDKQLTKVTNTPESEYSPTFVSDEILSTVRVESDGETQSLMIYDPNMQTAPRRLMPRIGNVGYHEWISDSEVALFLVRDGGHRLAIANVFDNKMDMVVTNIGRTLKYDGKRYLYFTQKNNDGSSFIKKYDTQKKQTYTVVKALEDVEDFELMRNGTLLAGKGSRLYFYTPNETAGWTVIDDLSKYDISDITRIEVRKNKIILVNNEG